MTETVISDCMHTYILLIFSRFTLIQGKSENEQKYFGQYYGKAMFLASLS